MSRFFSSKFSALTPYTPGEQPKDTKYIKLNTNESPFAPSPLAQQYAKSEAEKLELYSDPECTSLIKTAAQVLGLNENEIIFTNGSDEILNFAFAAFCDRDHPAVFADITYGFYPVFAAFNGVPFEEIPLNDDFSINVSDYVAINKNIFIANPNAPTGVALPLCDIEKIVASNPDNIVVVDEAYVDFGGESALPLIKKYDNLLVTQTFSKSRSMAGARLGFGAASPSLIRDLNTIRYSTNPYNVNRMTMAAGVGALIDKEYFEKNVETVKQNREYTTKELKKLDFTVLPSQTNFVFAKSDKIGGEELYLKLKANGILVRHFSLERIKDFNRITIGNTEEMQTLIKTITKILEES